jgi:hypothetical protein
LNDCEAFEANLAQQKITWFSKLYPHMQLNNDDANTKALSKKDQLWDDWILFKSNEYVNPS